MQPSMAMAAGSRPENAPVTVCAARICIADIKNAPACPGRSIVRATAAER